MTCFQQSDVKTNYQTRFSNLKHCVLLLPEIVVRSWDCGKLFLRLNCYVHKFWRSRGVNMTRLDVSMSLVDLQSSIWVDSVWASFPYIFLAPTNECTRGVTGGWAGWAIVHQGFGIIEGAAKQQQCTALLIAYLVLGSHIRPCVLMKQRIFLKKEGILFFWILPCS